MTKQETAKVIATLYEYYPAGKEGANLQSKVNAWHMILQDRDYHQAMAAVVAFAANDKKGFFPTPGAIIDQLDKLTEQERLTELEAWRLVEKAARNGSYGAEEEFERLPPEVKKAVGSPDQLKEWAAMDADTVKSVISSNFQRSYRVIQQREQEYRALPQSVKVFLDSVKLGSLENGNGQKKEQLHPPRANVL